MFLGLGNGTVCSPAAAGQWQRCLHRLAGTPLAVSGCLQHVVQAQNMPDITSELCNISQVLALGLDNVVARVDMQWQISVTRNSTIFP